MPAPGPTPPRISLRDIAAKVGVSHVTVSLALRGDTRISATRRNEITAMAERLGYRPDPMLASLSAYRQAKKPVPIRSTIAWLNQWSDPRHLRRLHEFDAYWHGAHDYAATLGYRLEEFVLKSDLSPARLQQILFARNVRGILLPPHRNGLNLPDFDWSQFSIVRLGTSVEHPRAHIVTSDQKNCAAMAFERMWEKGYRRIAYVTAHTFDRNTGGNFRSGYLTAQDEHVSLRKHLAPLVLSEEETPADARTLRRWLKTTRADAILSPLGKLSGLLSSIGCQVPRDIGVAALSRLDGNFDASVDQNSTEIGRVALATLAGLIQQNERGIPQYCRRVLVEGRWIDGTSLPPKNPSNNPFPFYDHARKNRGRNCRS